MYSRSRSTLAAWTLALGALVACQPGQAGRASLTAAQGDDDALASQEASEPSAYIRIPLRHLTPQFVSETGFARDHVTDEVYAFGYISRQQLEALPQNIFNDIIELDAKAWAKHRFDPRTLSLLPPETPARETEAFEDYHDYDALTAELRELAEAHPDIAQLESAGRSVQGRELWVLKVSDHAASDEGEPNLLYVANMHGDEVVGRELMIYLLRDLLSRYGQDARITNLVNNAQIFIMPSMNPDGFELERRENARGVDLNRDFPDFTSDPTDTPAGRAPETSALMAFHQRHHIVLALNFHGGEVCFNLPWDTRENDVDAERFGDDALMTAAGRAYADSNATMRANDRASFDRGLTYGYEWYEVDGGMQDWANFYRNSTHATVELSYTKWPESDRLAGYWEQNREALLGYLERGITGIHVEVTDTQGAPIANATIRVGSANRDVAYTSPRIHRPTITAAQTVTISAPGFATQTLPGVMPWAFADDARTVALTR